MVYAFNSIVRYFVTENWATKKKSVPQKVNTICYQFIHVFAFDFSLLVVNFSFLYIMIEMITILFTWHHKKKKRSTSYAILFLINANVMKINLNGKIPFWVTLTSFDHLMFVYDWIISAFFGYMDVLHLFVVSLFSIVMRFNFVIRLYSLVRLKFHYRLLNLTHIIAWVLIELTETTHVCKKKQQHKMWFQSHFWFNTFKFSLAHHFVMCLSSVVKKSQAFYHWQ